jgi:ribosomal protein L13E
MQPFDFTYGMVSSMLIAQSRKTIKVARMSYTADKVHEIKGRNLKRLRLGRGFTLEKLSDTQLPLQVNRR